MCLMYQDVIHDNKLPYISQACLMYQDVIHENKLPHVTHECDSGNEMLSMKKIYIASLLCVILVPKWYP